MCLNYNNNTCLPTRKACIIGEKGKDARKGECKLHGDNYVYTTTDNKVVLSNAEPENDRIKEMLAFYIEFLLADEIAHKKAARMGISVTYDLKK